MADRYHCLCCGFRTMDDEPPGTYGTCPVCGWMDHPLHTEQEQSALVRAQVAYVDDGAGGRGIRAPRPDEARDPLWSGLDDVMRRRDAAREALVQQIRDAFGAVTSEGRISLGAAYRTDMGPEHPPSDWDDHDTSWSEIPHRVLEDYASRLVGSVFVWGNAASYRYYLPAYMRYALTSHPTPALSALRHRSASELVDIFDRPQRDAIRAFLRYIAEFGSWERDADDAKRLLERRLPDEHG